MLKDIRAFFDARQVLEVETPILGSFGVTEPALNNMVVDTGAGRRYLQTSPEYAMKRLLSAGSGDIYQVTRAFRGAEYGTRHNPEFSILEWYRLGMDHHDLMDEVDALLMELLSNLSLRGSKRLSYREAFQESLDIDPVLCSETTLMELASERDLLPEQSLSRDDLLDLLLSMVVAKTFPEDQLSFIYDWPVSQAALARVLPDDPACAGRFEVYLGELELANGFWELSNADEQEQRFKLDRQERELSGLPDIEADPMLLDALRQGLPECSGVALGLDRILMLRQGAATINDVLAFPWERS
jgi:lysyl-tRNA synthetase class 2